MKDKERKVGGEGSDYRYYRERRGGEVGGGRGREGGMEGWRNGGGKEGATEYSG